MTNFAVNFSSGTLVAVRTDATLAPYPTPVKFGVLQEGSVEFSGTNKELYGQYQFPQDVARGPVKVAGKAKSAQLFSSYFDLFFGQGVTGSSSILVALSEAHSVPGSSTYTVTVTNAATFSNDLGVIYSTTGVPMTRVEAGHEVTGAYSVVETTGVYTFASGDASAALLFTYEYTSATLNKLTLTNQLMGTTPTFEIILATTYKGNIMNLHLNQCVSEKLTIPVKNTEYTIMDFDFQAYTNSANVLGTLSLTQ